MKMRILVIMSATDVSATGKVASRLLQGLSENGCEISVLHEYGNTAEEGGVEVLDSHQVDYKAVYANQFFTNLCILGLHYPLNEFRFVKGALRMSVELHSSRKYDVVMALSSASGLHVIEAGRQVSRKLGLPFYIHATDPMPAPSQWYKKQYLRKALILTARKAFRSADAISLSNEAMLGYQLDIMKLKKVKSFVVHNPTTSNFIESKKEICDCEFLYVGSIYHQRKPYFLIDAFQKFLSNGSKAQLKFLGRNEKLRFEDYAVQKANSERILKLPFVKDPSDLMVGSSVLVDFDANFAGDVFISSKLITYLNTDKPILCLTVENSPSDLLLADADKLGVVKFYYSDSNPEIAFQKALEMRGKVGPKAVRFRKELLQEFNAKKIGERIVNMLESIGGK